MGILLSIIRFLNGEDHHDHRVVQTPRYLSSSRRNNIIVADADDNNRIINNDVYTRQMKYLSFSEPNLRKNHYPSINAQTNVSTHQYKFNSATDFVNYGRWIKHYSSCHRILLVGEGDFSFSTCLAAAFGWASNLMIATSLDSKEFLTRNYHSALANIVELSIRNCKVMHEIDATTIATHSFLGCIKFDRIIFNFPFAGFFKNLSREAQLRLHRRLVSMFLKNAKEMLSEDGEIHISHKTNGFHGEWKLESTASSHRLRLIEAVDFNHLDYPGYNTKCGFGGDNNFNCYPSKTFKFGLKCSN